MEYKDLDSYEYYSFPIPMLSIGWLGSRHGIPGATEPPLSDSESAALHAASQYVSNLMLGYHECEFCPEGAVFEGNGEYHYYAENDVVYAAPVMILHYVTEHGYRPHRQFLDCLLRNEPPAWDRRAERFVAIVQDTTEDLVLRGQSVAELWRWPDQRAWAALRFAIADEELAGVAFVEIVESLTRLMHCDFAADLRIDDLPQVIREWMALRPGSYRP
ncbi:DUF7919 family protein [Nocardia sp. NPDC055321]